MKKITGFPSTMMDDYPLNMITFIQHAARSFPNQELVFDDGDNTKRTTYAEIYREIMRLANVLVKLGVKPGDRVAVLDWNTLDYFALYYAISGVGATLVQLNLRIAKEELAYVMNHSEARFLFINHTLLELAEQCSDELEMMEKFVLMDGGSTPRQATTLTPLVYLDELRQKQIDYFVWPLIDETTAYAACYTSGTSGRPKGVYYSHRSMYLHTQMIAAHLSLTRDSTLLLLVPMFHGQSWGFFFAATMMGAKLVLPGRTQFDTPTRHTQLVELMRDEKVTLVNGSPMVFQALFDSVQLMSTKPDFSSTYLFSGASTPVVSLVRDWHEATGARFMHGYGATETSPLVSLNRQLSVEQDAAQMLNQGLPVVGTDIRLVEQHSRKVLLPMEGQVGEVQVRGPLVTAKYHEAPGTEDRFDAGWWSTGDLMRIDALGQLHLIDRMEDLILYRGGCISSVELEACLNGHHEVREVVAIGVPHPEDGQCAVALVVAEPQESNKQNETLTQQRLFDYCAKTLPESLMPTEVIFVSSLPKSVTGKYEKRQLRERYSQRYAQ